MHDDQEQSHRVALVGGPLDGWPVEIRGRLPDRLRLPYSRAMLELAGRSPEHGEWQGIEFPGEAEADGVAVYCKVSGGGEGGEVVRYRYTRDDS
ncbi:MAG: hypothetical protein DWQ34_07135 [Planctomycetota bacterium]|nr:MAG: hypothetical protein DWQ34_07135 [Planctomycetota bacterium]REK23454.1 MAG: hypothetical protein DWQ41_17035 [Planctomycetota bacterium]REK38906.1 MAG: hypothetical protein DWQ45_03420 [Planctomycetota bacterium]